MFLLGLSPAQALPNQPNHIITEPIVTGPIATGPIVTSPIVTSPIVTDPIVTSPIVTGQALALDHLSFSFIPPEDSGQPRTNRAGGRRDQLCNHSMPTPSLTLLMPPTNQGTTTAEHPTFLAYIPQTSAQQVFLTMEDEDNNYFYHTTFPLPDQAGIVSFTMPDMAPSLKPEKYYKVSLAMMCGAILDPNDPVVEGWIKRVELDLPLSPDQGQDTALERSALYANNGLWFDAITALADLLRSQPDNPDIIDAWEELLQSVELELLQIELL